MSFSLVLLLVSKVGTSYGVGTADITAVLITPFQMLNAEHLPVWFSRREGHGRPFFSRGFTGNYLLLLWAVLGSLITLAFLCNIRAMLMKPVFEKPIDSTRDIFRAGNIPTIGDSGGFWPKYMRQSSNEWERLAGKTGDVYDSGEERMNIIVEKIYKDNSHVSLEHPQTVAFMLQNDEYFKSKQPPIFHLSCELFR